MQDNCYDGLIDYLIRVNNTREIDANKYTYFWCNAYNFGTTIVSNIWINYDWLQQLELQTFDMGIGAQSNQF